MIVDTFEYVEQDMIYILINRAIKQSIAFVSRLMIRKNYLSRSITNHSFFRLFEKTGHYFMTWYGALSGYHNSCLLHFLYDIVFVYVSSMMRVMVTYFLLS